MSPLLGSIGRFFRYRLQRGRAQREGGIGGLERKTGRFRLHGQRARGIPVLFQQRDEHFRGKDGGFRDCRTCFVRTTPLKDIKLRWIIPFIEQDRLFLLTALLLLNPPSGRKRIPRRATAQQTRDLPRTNLGAGGIHPQGLARPVHHQPKPEVLPHAGEPQHEHGQEHGEAHLQLQRHGERADGVHGRAAGLHRALLLPGREERFARFIHPVFYILLFRKSHSLTAVLQDTCKAIERSNQISISKQRHFHCHSGSRFTYHRQSLGDLMLQFPVTVAMILAICHP